MPTLESKSADIDTFSRSFRSLQVTKFQTLPRRPSLPPYHVYPQVNSLLHKCLRLLQTSPVNSLSLSLKSLRMIRTRRAMEKKSTHLTLTGNHEMETTNTDVEPGPANEPLRRGRGRPKKITVDSDRLGSTKSGQQPPVPVSQMQKQEKENLSSDEEVPQPPPKRTKTKQVKVNDSSY